MMHEIPQLRLVMLCKTAGHLTLDHARFEGEPEAQLNPKKKVFEKVAAHFKTSSGEPSQSDFSPTCYVSLGPFGCLC